MDFSKNIKQGRKVALAAKKKKVLVTFWVDEELRSEANRKCPNVSAYLTLCLEKLVASPIDKQIKAIYEGVAKEAVAEVGQSSQSKNNGNGSGHG